MNIDSSITKSFLISKNAVVRTPEQKRKKTSKEAQGRRGDPGVKKDLGSGVTCEKLRCALPQAQGYKKKALLQKKKGARKNT